MKLRSAFTYNSLLILFLISLGYLLDVTFFYIIAIVFFSILFSCSTKS